VITLVHFMSGGGSLASFRPVPYERCSCEMARVASCCMLSAVGCDGGDDMQDCLCGVEVRVGVLCA